VGRRRLVVALVPPAQLTEDVQAVRRLLGDPRVDRLAPHLTLVAPVNVDADAVGTAAQVLDAAAARREPFVLELGPVDTFAPATPTLHLRVGGDLGALGRLREAVAAPPLDRLDPRPFVPHVTLRNRADLDALPGALAALSGTAGSWTVDRVLLLEQHPHPDGGSCWLPLHEAPFGGPARVGRGGVELLLRRVGILEPAAAAVLGIEPVAEPVPAGRLVVSASSPARPDEPVAVAAGRVDGAAARLEHLVVERGSRGAGIATQVLRDWCSEAARAGCEVAVAAAGGADAGFLVGRGFVVLAGRAVRAL
jgi:2'-5' RNA ligase